MRRRRGAAHGTGDPLELGDREKGVAPDSRGKKSPLGPALFHTKICNQPLVLGQQSCPAVKALIAPTVYA